MERYHSSANDLPTMSARQRERDELEKAVAEFLSRQADAPPSVVETTATAKPARRQRRLSDQALHTQLITLAALGKSLEEAALSLGETDQRCKRLAIQNRIPFRSSAFRKKRSAQ